MFRLIVLALALGVLSGCGQAGPKKARVSGTVQMSGKPLDRGEIYFIVPGAGTPPEILKVADGKFEGEVTLGKKRIEVHSPKKMGQQGGMSMGQELVINRVHPDYNVNSKLTAEVADGGLTPSAFEVKADPGAK